jgi:phage terminase large subunit-like protein
VDACIKFPENIIAKPRQAGVSTTVAAFLATRAVFADPENPETILIIANKLKLAQKFLGTIKDFAGQFPRWIWGEEYYGTDKAEEKDILVKNSMIEFELPNKSKVIAVATSTDA